MELNLFLQKTSNIVTENKILKFAILVIGAVVIYNTLTLQKALNSQRTVLVPPVIDTIIEISGNTGSDEYIKSFTRYVMGLLSNYTPGTAKKQFDELLLLYHPESFPKEKQKLYELAESIQMTHKLSSIFYIQKIVIDKIDKADHRIEVTVNRKQYSEDQKIDDSIKTYFINYRIENGRFNILQITEKA